MNLEKLYEVPQALGEPHLVLVGDNVLRFLYERRGDGQERRTGLLFHDVAAVQIRGDRCIEEWQDESYFTLVEVIDSPWKASVLGTVDEQYAWYREKKHHYAILGLRRAYEFIADSWELLPDEEGWGDPADLC